MASRRKSRKKPKKATVPSTSEIRIRREGNLWRLWIDIVPVPASRPRFSRWGGPCYGKRYTAFREEMAVLLDQTELPVEFPLSGDLEAYVVFGVVKPKTSKRTNPRGDIDNYFKTLDVFNGVVWKDDDQLVGARMQKEFADAPCIYLEVYGVSQTRALPEMWEQR